MSGVSRFLRNASIILTVLLLMYGKTPCAAEEVQSPPVDGGWWARDGKKIGCDAGYLYDTAASAGWREAALLGGFIGATALIAGFLDEPVRRNVRGGGSRRGDALALAGRTYGGESAAIAAPVALYGVGFVSGSEGVRDTGRVMAEALILAELTTGIFKGALGRSRPYTGNGADDFRFFRWKDRYMSMPSGHTTVAFTISSVLASRINRWWASAILYSMAGLTAWSRVYDDRHWASDVFFGGAIGAASGILLSRAQRRCGDGAHIAFSPRLLVSGAGVAVVMNFD